MEIAENGIVRLQTRIGNSQIAKSAKSPILLPKKSEVIRLLMTDAHHRMLHTGVDGTLTEFLMEYSAPSARRVAKLVVEKCAKCKKARGPSYALPRMPALPADRPFESVGMDYLGPSIVRGCNGTHKAYILLITCLTTRAVHLEATWDLSGEQLLQALRRFVARRGIPARVLSDNGTQFRSVAKMVTECQHKMAKIEWRFIGQLSPWQGGIYERIVALVKAAFKTTLGRRVLTEEEFRTFTTEVEGALNCRPLTFVSIELDGFKPLRPVDFLSADAELAVNSDAPNDDSVKGPNNSAEYWKATQSTFDYF